LEEGEERLHPEWLKPVQSTRPAERYDASSMPATTTKKTTVARRARMFMISPYRTRRGSAITGLAI
jgi:hypothetical protein